jgi:hypothetical protein
MLIAIYQLYVTVRVLRSERYSSHQRIVQTCVIWLIPVLGAVICHLVLGFRDTPTSAILRLTKILGTTHLAFRLGPVSSNETLNGLNVRYWPRADAM